VEIAQWTPPSIVKLICTNKNMGGKQEKNEISFTIKNFNILVHKTHSGLCTCKVGALPLEPHPQFILFWLFWGWISQTICPGWPWTELLFISASQVAEVTHQCPTMKPTLNVKTFNKLKNKGIEKDTPG
jgi:hypothetical protein